MQIVRSEIFSRYPELLFGMSTKDGGVSPGTLGLNLSYNVGDDPQHVVENRKRFFSVLGITEEQVAYTGQQHTTRIVSVDQPGFTQQCDALITAKPYVYVSISIADCTPVMLYDPNRKVVAAVHAGWRGTAGRIVEKTLHQLQKEFGSDLQDVVAFIGPSAGNCCYEVGAEVALQFHPDCRKQKNGGKYLLDVKKANVLQLLENGVVNSNIETHVDCSIHNTEYHSHRRDGKASGRMLAVIGITN